MPTLAELRGERGCLSCGKPVTDGGLQCPECRSPETRRNRVLPHAEPVPALAPSRVAERAPEARSVRRKGKPKLRGVPNQTERRYAAEVLEFERMQGWIGRYEYEGLGLWVPGIGRARKDGTAGPGLYTADYVCWLPDGRFELREVKGAHIWPKDRKQFLASAQARPWVRHLMMQWKGGAWRVVYDLNAGERT